MRSVEFLIKKRAKAEERRLAIYRSAKSKLAIKTDEQTVRDVFSEVGKEFDMNPRSVSNIYYSKKKADDRGLLPFLSNQKKSTLAIAWLKGKVKYPHLLEVETKHKHHSSLFWNAFQDEDYGFEFKIEIDHNYYESGNGYDEPMTYDMIPTSWEIELINVFDAEGNEIRLNKYEIADVEEYIHRNVCYSLRLVQ